MKTLKYIFLLQLLSFNSFAFEIPNHFEDGQVTSASQMNENFQALKSEIEILKNQIEEKQESRTAFVGVTEEKFNGQGTIIEMIQACGRMLSGSHFCTEDVYVNSVKPENVEIKEGWLLDTFYYSHAHCSYFSNDYGSALALNNLGNITSSACTSQLGVACCK